jgi:hypothetical protein
MSHRKVTSALIARPIGDVFDWVVTPANWPRVSPLALGIDAAEPDRPLSRGDEFTEHVRVLSWLGRFDWTVETLDRPFRCVLTATSRGESALSRLAGHGTARIELTLAEDGGKTLLSRELTYDEGFLAIVENVLGFAHAVDSASEIAMQTTVALLENPLLHGPQVDNTAESLLHQADPLADEAVASLVGPDGDCTRLERFLGVLYRGDPPPQDVPEPMARLLGQTAARPAWACEPYIEAASQVFFEWGVLAVGAHLCASLPETYVMPRVAKLLNDTHQLDGTAKQSDRRLWFTVRMCLDVLAHKGLDAGGPGLLAVQRLRLIHATVRMFVTRRLESPHRLARLSSTALWDTPNGQPISQLELLHTLMTFSHVVVRAFDDLGCRLTPFQREAYIHLWNVAGANLGIRPEYLPRDAADAARTFEVIKQRYGQATAQAVKLGEGLVTFWTSLFPKAVSDDALELMRFVVSKLITPQTAAINGFNQLPEFPPAAAKKVNDWLNACDRLFRNLFDDSGDAAHAVSLVISLVMRKVTDSYEHDSGMFDIPEKLYERWSGITAAAP